MLQGLVQWARIVLLCADGPSNKEVLERIRVTRMTVGKWRHRFIKQVIEGLHDEFPGGGRAPATTSG